MTQDQIKYQEIMEQKRHDLETERLTQSDIAQRQRATSVSEKWYKDQIDLKKREQELKEAQYKTHKSEWAAEYLQNTIGQFLHERDSAWSRFKDAYNMSEFALFQ